jgi:hypothetical protein
VYLVLNSKQFSSSANGLHGESTLFPFNFDLFIYNVLRMPEYFAGFWGYFWGLGWKFEPPLNNTYLLFASAVSIFVVWNFYRSLMIRTKKIIFVTILFLFAIPLLMLQNSNATVGDTVQPRYMLPLGVGVLATIAISSVSKLTFSHEYHRKLFMLIPTCIFIISSISTNYIMLQRNINGLNGPLFLKQNLNSWWWDSIPLSPMLTFFLHVVAVLGMSLFFYESFKRSTENPSTAVKQVERLK